MTFVAAFGAAEKPTYLSSLANVLAMNDQTSTSDVRVMALATWW